MCQARAGGRCKRIKDLSHVSSVLPCSVSHTHTRAHTQSGGTDSAEITQKEDKVQIFASLGQQHAGQLANRVTFVTTFRAKETLSRS